MKYEKSHPITAYIKFVLFYPFSGFFGSDFIKLIFEGFNFGFGLSQTIMK